MAGKRRGPKKSSPKRGAAATRSAGDKPSKKRKVNWKAVALLLVLATLSYAGLAAYKQNWDQLHDLSVIGNGVPTVVQVHDPHCGQCRILKDNTQSALKRLDSDGIQYRIADLSTSQGQGLASRHHAGKVTLLTFDGSGNFLQRYTGVRSVDSLQALFSGIAKK